ncbi:UBP-type zinc finger domain-containing protein [Streptomyces hypolithicus]
MCLACGHVGCCDSSRGQHAWAHADRTEHALARSVEKGERWAWCYRDELFLEPVAE